eukprot:scaffold82036_cov82-Cyclotella_meneghiniana.AAC.1
MTPHNKQLTSQQFRITANEQIESIIYPGRVLSVAIQTTSWMCKKGDEEIGLVTVDGNLEPESSVCNSKKECNRSCTIDPTPIHDYCMDGNKVLLKDSSPNNISQKWRFYHNSIMNLACKRTPLFQGLAISQIYDNAFKDVPLFDQLELSFVNNGVAISVGEKDENKCFQTKSELREAVMACSFSSSSVCIEKKKTYGWSINNWCIGNEIYDLSELFKGTTFNEPINDWDVSKVERMDRMFYYAKSFSQNLSKWNTERVTTMQEMFYKATAFNGNIENWNTGRVTRMDAMFYEATSFNRNIGNWNTARVITMAYMFNRASAFNGNIGNWNTAQVTTMRQMFYKATAFNGNIENWNTGRVTTMQEMFAGATSFNRNIGNWNTARVITMEYMFDRAYAFNGNIGSWNVSNVQIMRWKNAIPYNSDTNIFYGSGCRHTAEPLKPTNYYDYRAGFKNFCNRERCVAGSVYDICENCHISENHSLIVSQFP